MRASQVASSFESRAPDGSVKQVPALSTVGQQKAEMGRLSVERLVQALDDPGAACLQEVVRLPMVLHARESTGCPPADVANTANRGEAAW